MKLPSLDSLVDKSSATFRRFPLAMIFTMLGAGVAITLVHLPYNLQESHFYYWNMLMSCYLGMLLFVSLQAYAERKELKGAAKAILQLAGMAAIVIYYLTLPGYVMTISIIRFALFSIGLHLLIAFIPFIGSGQLNGFWQYNKILFLRILTSALYSGVLYLGLALAIVAIDQLFKAHIEGRVYGDLWVFMAGIFNTWFFLAGFPRDFSHLESETGYPKGLKIFTQYVLIPLITVYLLILYAYMSKILITMEWPIGWVSYLVLGFSIAGILSLLLIHPVRNDADNKWMLVFSRFFYFAIFPLIVLLFFAIKRRIQDYGITENRYFVLVLALWLVFIAVYFLVSKAKNIKLIPLSLCLVAFLTSFGPWGAFSVSLNSQKKHFEELLTKNKMIDGGKIKKRDLKISYDDNGEISSVVNYIVDVHGYRSLQPYFLQDLDSLMKSDSTISYNYSYGQVNKILGLMDISYVAAYQPSDDENYFNYHSQTDSTFSISGYDYFMPGYSFDKSDENVTRCSSYLSGAASVKICFDPKKNQLSIEGKADSALRFEVSPFITSLRAKSSGAYTTFKQEEMTWISENEYLAAKVLFRNIYGTASKDSLRIKRIDADIMIRVKQEKVNEVGERNQ